MNTQKPPNYWRQWDNVAIELGQAMEVLGHFPTVNELKDNGYSSLAQAVYQYHGGYIAVREKLIAEGSVEIAHGQRKRRKLNGFWDNFENVIQEVGAFMEEHGCKRLPTQKMLSKHNRSDISSAIARHGGFNRLRRVIGEEINHREKGYWQEWKNVERELRKAIDKLGHFPTEPELRSRWGGLASAIQKYYGGMHTVAERLGYNPARVQRGFWSKWENVKETLERIIQEEHEFPTQGRLIELGHNSLPNAIRAHGGMNAVRKRLGHHILKRDNSYWKDREHIRRELIILENELGHFPSSYEVQNLNAGLGKAIREYHGGYIKLREELGHESQIKQTGHWQEWKNVKQELETIIAKLGHFPSSVDLQKIKRGSLSSVICKYYGGFREVRKKMGCGGSIIKENGYWQEWKNVERELRKAIDKLGHFPTDRELRDQKVSGLTGAINKYHGKLGKARERMGYEKGNTSKGYYQEWKNVEQELDALTTAVGHFPTKRDFLSQRKSGLLTAIHRDFGGLREVQQRMGHISKRRPNGYLADWNNLEHELRKIIRENEGDFPSSHVFEAIGETGLIAAIHKYHGGMYKVRERLGFKEKTKPDGYWQQWNNVKKELETIIGQEGKFPSMYNLRKLGLSSLAMAMSKYHGGVQAVRLRLQEEGILPSEEQQLEQLVEQYVEG